MISNYGNGALVDSGYLLVLSKAKSSDFLRSTHNLKKIFLMVLTFTKSISWFVKTMRKIFSNLVCFSESLNFKDCWKPNCCHGAVGHFGQCIFELLQYWCWKSFCNSKLTRLKKLSILSLQDNKKWSLLKTRNLKN